MDDLLDFGDDFFADDEDWAADDEPAKKKAKAEPKADDDDRVASAPPLKRRRPPRNKVRGVATTWVSRSTPSEEEERRTGRHFVGVAVADRLVKVDDRDDEDDVVRADTDVDTDAEVGVDDAVAPPCHVLVSAPPLRRLRRPFLPWETSVEADFDSWQSVQQHDQWQRHLRSLAGPRQQSRKRDFILHGIRLHSLQGRPVLHGKYPGTEPISLLEDHAYLLPRDPFGPAHLRTSSRLRHFVRGGRVHLAYCDGRNAVRVRRLARTQKGDDGGTVFRYRPAGPDDDDGDDPDLDLVDYDRPLDATLGGLQPIRDSTLFALRHQDCLSLLNADGETVRQWKQEPTQGALVDAADLAFLDSLVSLDERGDVRIVNYDSGQVVNVWEHEFFAELADFGWGRLEPTDNQSVFSVATRKCVRLFDSRVGKKGASALFEVEANRSEVVCAVARSRRRGLHCVTSDAAHLLDERWPGRSVSARHHRSKDLLAGCAALLADDGVEYVATHSFSGEVQLWGDDWRHSECRETSPCLRVKQEDGARPPLKRGPVAHLPAVKTMLGSAAFDTAVPARYLRVPWTGLTLVSEGPGELVLFAVNAVGQLFACEMGAEDGEDDEDTGRDESQRRRRGPAIDWLLRGDDDDPKELAHLLKWARSVDQAKFPKICLVSSVYRRPALPLSEKLKRSLPQVVAKKPTTKKALARLAKEKQRPKIRGRRPGQDPVKLPPYHFRSCPSLETLDPSENPDDQQAANVVRILAGETIFPEIVDAESDTLHRPLNDDFWACVRKGKGAGPARAEKPAVPAATASDAGLSMSQFASGLEDGLGMVSTQQEPCAGDSAVPAPSPPPLVAASQQAPVDSTQQASFYASLTQSQAKKRKRTKFKAGF